MVLTEHEVHQGIAELLKGFDHPSADLEITGRTALADGGLELTSLDLIRVIVGLEEHFGVELNDDLIFDSSFDSVSDLVTVLLSGSSEAELDRR
ncbi:hypothetical protein GCM10029976_032480 [Kribbella albertanoniae]|uniref:Acyl carrier protein n=1 Tax=Kribbella albertanoniae TaxID=1266829 RepID=A0A4R4QIL8_9ACTN|nr:acyl carrier protein [Kribbella albertanoniae]TDC35528.1 acyl carrier protein [Kribbella albertanoniae]